MTGRVVYVHVGCSKRLNEMPTKSNLMAVIKGEKIPYRGCTVIMGDLSTVVERVE